MTASTMTVSMKVKRELKRLQEHHTIKDDMNMLQQGQFSQPENPLKRKRVKENMFFQPNRRRKVRIGKKYQVMNIPCVSSSDTYDADDSFVLISNKQIEMLLSQKESICKLVTSMVKTDRS